MIQKYTKENLEEILSIWLDASALAHHFVPQSYWQGKVVDMRDVYIPNSDTYVYLGEDKKIKGFISLVDNFIAAVFVAPKEQGKGIGKELMNYAKSLKDELELCVYAQNTDSVEFYKKQGFEVAEEKEEVNTGHIELVMKYTV